MTRRIVVIDTSVLCCFLKVPTKDTAGSKDDLWDCDRVKDALKSEEAAGSTFVLPIATLIETGNHIANAPGDKHEVAIALMDLLSKTLSASAPWAAFADQEILWSTEKVDALCREWPKLAVGGLTIGDATIKNVADYYAAAGMAVKILTADQGLKAYEPPTPVQIPRRRRPTSRG